MFRWPPHREPRLLALAAIATAGLPLLGLPAAGPLASQDHELQGQIPKAPPQVDGFPIPFFRTADYRPRDGAVVPADVDGDGRIDLVVSIPNGTVTVLRSDGTRLDGWPRLFGDLPQPAYPIGSPAVGDLDGDGSPEIVTCVVYGPEPRQSLLVALRADGTDLPGWPVDMSADGGYSCSAAGTLLADLDGDGLAEVVRGMSPGEVQAIDGDGRRLPGWPFSPGPDGLGRTRAINTDLAAADLDGDGRDEVILVESGFEPRLFAVEGRGRVVAGFPMALPQIVDRQSPVAADLDGDGRPEVVQATSPFEGEVLPESGEPSPGEPRVPAALYVVRADGSHASGWPGSLDLGGPWGSVLADLTGDGLRDIVQNDGDLVRGFDGWGEVLPGFPLVVHRDFKKSQSVEISPWIIADADGDGRLDLIHVRTHMSAGSAYLRVFGLRASGQSLKGFPFDAEGLVAASRPVAVDLSGDAIPDLVLLTTQGTSGSYSLLAWDLGSLVRRSR
jgi:hypothetical protein